MGEEKRPSQEEGEEDPQPDEMVVIAIQEPVEESNALKERLLALFKLSYPYIAVALLLVIIVLCCILFSRIKKRPAHYRNGGGVPQRSRAKTTTKAPEADNGSAAGN